MGNEVRRDREHLRERRSVAAVRFDRVDPSCPAAAIALGRYFDELDDRFRGGFDRDAGGAAELIAMTPPDGGFVLLVDDDATVGCGGVQRHDDRTGEIKRMWIDPEWRGIGLGRRLLSYLEDVARELGHRRVVLDTNETLREAIAMYERAGYAAVARYNDNPYAHHWFAKDL